jgi:hypothetical protein
MNEEKPGQSLRVGIFGRAPSGRDQLAERLSAESASAGGWQGPERIEIAAGEAQAGGLKVPRALGSLLDGLSLAVLVVSPQSGFGEHEEAVLMRAERMGIPVIGVVQRTLPAQPLDGLADFLRRRGLATVCLETDDAEGLARLRRFIVARLAHPREATTA